MQKEVRSCVQWAAISQIWSCLTKYGQSAQIQVYAESINAQSYMLVLAQARLCLGSSLSYKYEEVDGWLDQCLPPSGYDMWRLLYTHKPPTIKEKSDKYYMIILGSGWWVCLFQGQPCSNTWYNAGITLTGLSSVLHGVGDTNILTLYPALPPMQLILLHKAEKDL